MHFIHEDIYGYQHNLLLLKCNMSQVLFHTCIKFMKMHQFAFVQKCPALTSTALPPLLPPLNIHLTLSRDEVNMSMAPCTGAVV